MTFPTPEQQRHTLKRLDTFSYYTDSNIRIPFTKVRFGLSPLLGFIPVIGDFAGLILSIYVLIEARKVGATSKIQRRIIRNMLIDFFFGLFPVIGDAFDMLFKANTRNTEILRGYLLEQLDEVPPKPFPWFTLAWLTLLVSLLLWVLSLLWL